MNTIAMHLDHIADELRLANNIAEARQNYRILCDALAITGPGKFRQVAHGMAIEALFKLTRLEKEYRDNFAPFEEIAEYPENDEPYEWKTDETFEPRQRVGMTADERADDPRRGQGRRL